MKTTEQHQPDPMHQKQTQRRNEMNVDAQTVLNEVINQMQSGTVQNKHIEELLQYLADRLRFLSGKKQYGYLKADLKAVVDEVVDELAKDPRVAAAYNLWYELREDVLRTYKDNLPERLPLSGQKEFKRIKNLVILEAVKLEQYQQVFHPDDLWDGNPDEHAEEAQLFVYEQMNQSMSHPPEAAEAGQARTQYALGKIYRDGQGVEKDVQKAVELFTLAAMQGNSFAAFALGKMYLSDDPALSRNVAAALKWITNAAEHYLKHMDGPMGQSPAAAVITLFHSLANIFREQNQLPSGGIMVAVDRKLLRKIKAKKIAQGHKADDHEPKIGLQ